jgi:hypothetical protein
MVTLAAVAVHAADMSSTGRPPLADWPVVVLRML